MRRIISLATAGAAIGLMLGSQAAAVVGVASITGATVELPARAEIAPVPLDQIDRINGLERKPEKGGGVVILVRSTSAQGVAPTDTDNDYTRIVAGIGAAATLGNGTILELEGTFDWTEAFAAADYEADGFGPLAPTGLADITITAQALGDAVVIGPGDLPELYFEGFLYFYGGTYQGWTISNLELRDFDWTLGFFYTGAGGSTEDFNGLSVVNNRIVMPRDLNGTVAPAGTPPVYGDAEQNIGIHMGFGENQQIANNEFIVPGDSESDTLNDELAASVVLQSNTSGGNAYDGLMIVDNTIRVLNAPVIDVPNNIGAPFIVGIWENSGSNAADITVANNTFINEDPANDPADNLQQAFRHSSQASAASGREVRYEGNHVEGANVGISWLVYSSPINYDDTSVPVEVIGNTILDTTIGVRVRSDDGDARARLRSNRIANSTTGLLVDQGDADAIDNWWGCNEGPAGGPGCSPAATPAPLGGFPSTFTVDPWLTLTLSAAPSPVEINLPSQVMPSLQRNSAGAELGAIDFPETEVALATTLGALAPTALLIDGIGAAPLLSPDTGAAKLTATLDNATATASVLVVDGGVVVVESTGETSTTPTATDNDYTRINDVVQAVGDGVTVELLGTFDWTEANAAASWAAGSDGNPATADDNFGIVAPAGLDGVTIRAASLGDAIIQGPGDLPTEAFEGFLFLFGGTYQGWTIENLDIRGFDWSIGMFCCSGPGGSDQFDDVSILGNRIEMPTDLAAIGPATADNFQNVGIHYAFGSDQTISGNEIIIPGNGASDSGIPARAASVGMQSNTSGGAVYDGLEISNNLIRITGEQNADPERIYGIWENGHAHSSNIEIVANVFVNEHPNNDPALNFQRAFRVTSHSSASTTVAYRRNRVEGANIGIHWIGDGFTSEPPSTVEAVVVEQNALLGNGTGIWVHSDNGNTNARADVHFNRIVGNTTGLRSDSSGVDAENNWWGCNEGPNMAECDTAVSSGTPPTPPAVLLDADPWLIVRTFLFSSPVQAGNDVTVLVDSTFNSDLVGGLLGLPDGVVADLSSTAAGVFDDTQPSFVGGVATTNFAVNLATPAAVYSVDAALDNEIASAALTVTAPPTANLGAGVLLQRVIVDDGEVATVDVLFTNAGPDPVTMAAIAVDFPDAVGAWTWTCEADPGAACSAASGNGDVSGTVDLPAGATVAITGTATAPTPFTGVFPGNATIAPPAGVLDPTAANDLVDFQVRSVRIFDDGFESGDTSAWSATVP